MISILHLSDIHFRTFKNVVETRTKSIVDSLFALEPDFEICIVALSGDIAFSGKAEEYQRALNFVIDLQDKITSRRPQTQVVVVAVPGNHDCDFSADLSMRELLVPALVQKIDEELPVRPLDEILKPQLNFFDFRKTVCHPCPDSVLDRLCYTHNIKTSNLHVQVHCYNTAFLSKLNEDQGKLLFPLKAAESNIHFQGEADLSISLLHHPGNWIESVNETRFTAYLEKTSDLVLTGHQHVENAVRKQNISTQSRVLYVSGDALQEDNPAESGFNVILCDVGSQRYQIAHLVWRGSLYLTDKEPNWTALERNESIRHLFLNNKTYSDYLLELGTGFTHPRRKTLLLADLFVYPDLTRLNVMKKEEDGDGIDTPPLSSKQLPSYIRENEVTFILGGHQSGKTALAKKLYTDLQRIHRYVPVMLKGEDLGSANETSVFKALYGAFEKQYSSSLLDSFKQLNAEKRIVIIDDLDHSRLNRKRGYAALISVLKKICGRLVLIADDLFQFEELAADGEGILFQIERLSILPLSRQQRSRLIEKWHLLDEEMTYQQRELTQAVLNIERFVESLIFKDLLPCHPVFILAALQSYEATRAPSATTSSYGSIYEALLTGALFNQSGNTADVEKDKILLSHLAFFMFSQEIKSVSKQQIEQICEEYKGAYHIPADATVLIGDATAAQILSSTDNSYRFRYQYSYYYFVGRYFATNLQDDTEGPALRAKLLEMSDYVYYDEYAHVLLFALYLSKDNELIKRLVANADQIYSDKEVCDLDKHVAFLNKIMIPEQDALPDPDAKKNRELDREQRDHQPADQIGKSQDKLKYHSGLDDIIKLNIAFKTLQLLGQVVRDSPASLKANVKVEVIRAVYQLGLRVLRVVLQDAESNLEHLKGFVSEIISEHNNYLTPREVALATDYAVTAIARQCTYGIIKRISFAVGLEKLEQTYSVLLQKFGSVPAIRLVDLSIRLDHFTEYPEANIEKLLSDLRKNFFASRVLRDLVLNHMRLVEIGYRTRQRIGELLDVKDHAPQFRLAPKRLKAKDPA